MDYGVFEFSSFVDDSRLTGGGGELDFETIDRSSR